MKKRAWMLALTVLLAVSLAGAVYAMPSLGGPTGIVSLPNTGIAPEPEMQVAVTYQPFEAMGMYSVNDATCWSLQILRGVSDEAELWAAYSRVHDGENSDIWRIGGKYSLEGEWPGDLDVAVGGSVGRWVSAFDVPWLRSMTMYGGEPLVTDVDIKKLYVVASRSLTPVAEGWESGTRGIEITANAGLMYISIDPDAGGQESTARPFVGLEIKQGTSVWGLEYRAKDNDLDDKAVFSALLRRPIGMDTYVEVGVTNVSPLGLGLENQEFFARVGYDYPLEVGYY